MPKAIMNWVREVYGNGRGWHVGNMVHWNRAYYICFLDAAGHRSEDSQIRVCSSTNLHSWTSHIAIGGKAIDPNLLAVDDTLLLYGVKEVNRKGTFEFDVPSQQVVTSTKDGTTWTGPKECFLMNHEFWHPTEFNGRHYVACDTVGHTAHSTQHSVNPLTSEDGERCKWVTEMLHGSDEPEYCDTSGTRFGAPAPSETSLLFFNDGRLLAITRSAEIRDTRAFSQSVTPRH